EQERVQKKTFTNWLNTYLTNADPPFKVQDLFEDIKNGILLIRILEVLSGEKLVKLVNVNPTDIADGKPAIVLGLIWVIILYFQIEEQEELLLKILDLPPGSLKTRGSAKRALQAWVQEIFAGKYDVKVRDFGPSWRDGIAFNAMVHNIDSSLVEMEKVKTRTAKENLEHAFSQAEKHLGIPRLLDPEDVDVDRPDEKSIVTYVAQFFKAYPDAGRRRTDSPTKTDVKLQLDNIMKFIRESEVKLKTIRSSRFNLNEEYQAYEQLISSKEKEEVNFESLKDQWYSGLISHTDSLINPSEVEILEESWNNFTDTINDWLWEIDGKVPGEFGRISKWLSQAEKWFKQVGLKWYQKSSSTEAMGFCGTIKESWRPSSAEPPHSPPSSELLDKLLNEKVEIFGTNNHKLNSIRDDLSRAVGCEKTTNLPSSLIDRLGERLSKVTGCEPGNTAVVSAAKARRTFLDILYNVNRTETATGVRIRSRRRESATGFEHRFCNWLDLVDGNLHTETKEMVNSILTDYQFCLKTEHVPEKLDQCKCDLSKHYRLLIKIAQYDDQLLPKNALDIVQRWQDDCEVKWNIDKFNQLIQLGERIKQRLTVWDQLDQHAKNIEAWLSQFEDSTSSENDWFNRRDEIFRLLEEANEAARYLGDSADHHKLEMFQRRIEKLEADALKRKRDNIEKLEAKRIADKLKLEQEMNEHLNKIQCWINSVKELIDNKTSSKLKNLHVRCTSNELKIIVEQLQNVLDQQPEILEHLQNAIQLYHNPNIQPLQIEQNNQLNYLEEQIEKFSSLLSIKLKDLIDLNEKTYEIEHNLNDVTCQINQLEQKQNNILLNIDINKWDNSQLCHDFNDCRGHLTFTNGQVNDLERALNLQTNHGMAILNKFSVEELYDDMKCLNDRLNTTEKVIKCKLSNKQLINDVFTTFKQQLDEIQFNLNDIKYTTINNNKINKEDLMNLYDKLKVLRLKYTESMKTNDRQCQNCLNSVVSQGDGDMLLNEMKLIISQMKNDINERCVNIDNELQQLDNQLNESIKSANEIEEKAKQADEWLIQQEHCLTTLTAGPSKVSNNTVDSILERIKYHQQWVDECKRLTETIKKQSQKYDQILGQNDVDSVFETGSSLSNLVEVMCKRMENLESNAKKISNEADNQLKYLTSFSTQLDLSRKWLRNLCNEHNEKWNSLTQCELDQKNSMNKFDVMHKCLIQFTEELNNEGEKHLIQCRNEIQQIVNSSGSYDTTDIVKLAHQELSNFQLELNNVQKENEKELKEIEGKITRHSILMHNIESEIKWLNDVEEQLNEEPSSHNNSQFLTEVTLSIQNQINSYNQLLCNVNLHNQHINEEFYHEANLLNDSISLKQIDNLKNKFNVIKQNLNTKLINLNEQIKVLHTFQIDLDHFKVNLNNFNCQLNSIIELQSSNYVNKEIDSQLLETTYTNMKIQIENLLKNQLELQTKFHHLESIHHSIQFIKLQDFYQCQHDLNQFNNKLNENYNEIQLIFNELKQLNQLIDNLKNYLNLNIEQILQLLNKQTLLLPTTYSIDFNEYYQLYEKYFNEIQIHCIQLNIDLSINSITINTTNNLTKLSLNKNEINEKFNYLIKQQLNYSQQFKLLQNNFNEQINQLIKIIFKQLMDYSQFINNLHKIHTNYNEIQINYNVINKEFENISIIIFNEFNNQQITTLNNLLNRIQNEITVKQLIINKLIDNNVLKQFINNDILLHCFNQLNDKKQELINKINELIEKCKYFMNFEKNSIDNLNTLKYKLNDVKQLINKLKIEKNSLTIDYEQQLSTINESLTVINNQYKIICQNIKEININSNIINELLTMISLNIEENNKNLLNLQNDYKKQKEIYQKLQLNMKQCKENLKMIHLNLKKSITKFTLKSINNLKVNEILQNYINDFNDYLNDFNIIQELINKMTNNLLMKSSIIQKPNNELYEIIIEIIDLINNNNNNNLSIISIQFHDIWYDFSNELNTLINWIQQCINEFNEIQIDYQNILNKIQEIDKSLNECNELINDKLQTIKINHTFDQLKSQQQQQQSIKSKLIDDLYTIKEQQLMHLLNEFKAIKQSVNQLIIKPQINLQLKFIDDNYLNELIHRVEQSLDVLCNQLNDNILHYKTMINNECQLIKLYENVNDWILNYENELLNVENNLNNVKQSNHSNNLQSLISMNKNLEHNLQIINNLEVKYSHGEKLFELLINKCNELHESLNNSELDELHNRLITLNTQRLHNTKTNLLNIKDNFDNFTAKSKNIDEELLKYEETIDKLKQLTIISKINKLDDLLIQESIINTTEWKNLLIDLRKFKHHTLEPYEVLHNQSILNFTNDYIDNIKKRYNQCLLAVNEQIELNDSIVTKINKLKEKLQDFIRLFKEANDKFQKIINHLKIDFNEQYFKYKLSEICNSIVKSIQQANNYLHEFDVNFIEKLQTTQLEISSQIIECELSVTFENSSLLNRFNALKHESDDIQHDLNELNNELINITTEILNYEQWFENVDKKYQQMNKDYPIEDMLCSISNLYHSSTLLSINELQNESNNNSSSLTQLHSHYQKSLQLLRELQKEFIEYNPIYNNLSERLLTYIRQMNNIHISFLKINKDLQSDCQIVTNQTITTNDVIEPNCNHIKQLHQTLMNNINQDINSIQTKSTYLSRLIQSNKDLDEWIQEFIEFISQFNQNQQHQQSHQGINQDNARIEQIQLKLDIGKAYIHSIHDWIEQLKQCNQNNSIIINLLNQQIKRSNQIYQYLINIIDVIKNQYNQYNQLINNYKNDLLSIDIWFKQWKDKFTLIQLNITKLLLIEYNQNSNEFITKVNIDIEHLMNCLNELNNELINKQTLLLTIMNEKNHLNIIIIINELNTSIQLNVILQEMNEYKQKIEQSITYLKCIKIKLKELYDYLNKTKQWMNEITEQFYRIRDGKSPIRVSPYPSRNDSIKSEYSKTIHPIDTQFMSNTIISSTSIKSISLNQSNEFHSNTQSIPNYLLQQLRNKLNTINLFIDEITKSSTLTNNNIHNLLNELHNNLFQLHIDYTIITNEIDQIQYQLKQIITMIIDYKQNIEILINQLNQLNDTLNNNKNWLINNLQQIKKLSQQSISGIIDLSLNQSILDNNEQLIDIFCPLDEIIQNYQVFQSELMSHKCELTQLNSLCESIQERSNESEVKKSLNQLLMQYHNLIKSCEDVLSKLQQVFMENREFQVLCNSVRHFLDNILTELKGINKGDQNSNLSEADLNTITNIREKLRSSQSKLLELSDRADRICRASSTAALTINQMFIMHTSQLVDITDSVNTPMYIPHNQQFSTNQHRIDNLHIETVGSKAKRQLNEFRKEFSEISQQITEYQEKVNHSVNEQKTLSELYNDLRIWIDKTEMKLSILESGRMVNQTDVNEQNIKPLMHGSNKFNENDWNIYVQQVKALNKELNEYSQKFEQFCDIMSNTTTKINGQTSKFNQLIGRFTEIKRKIKQCTNWINAIQQNYTTFRESAQTTERWMSSINFRLISAGNNTINNQNQITNLTTYQDSTVQIDQLIREIDKEGKNLLENTHHLVHLLIHAITKDQISRTNRICENVNCPYREIPIDHNVVDNWKYLVNNSTEEKLLDMIALDALERNKEIETSYINIHSNAQSIKSRLDDQSNRFKSYIDSLNSTATFILNDLQSWWKRLSVMSQSSAAIAAISGVSTTNQSLSSSNPIISHQHNVTGFTSYPNKSFINYQIDRLKQLSDEKLPAKAISLEDVGHQLAMTLAMQSKLISMKRELSTLAYKCGMSSIEIDYIVQENDKNSDNKGDISDQNLVKLLAKHVRNAIDIENKKLEYHTEQLRELRTKWEYYVKERDIFNRWLSERQTACHHLLELKSRSTQPENEESRALEDFLHSLKDKEYQLSELLKMHEELIQQNSHTTDPLLDRLNTEYKNLLNQTLTRINRIEKEKNQKKIIDESHSEYRGKIPILPEKAEALVRSSNKTLNHTKLLNELAKSVSQLKNEVITNEVDAQRSYLVDQRDYHMLSTTTTTTTTTTTNTIQRTYTDFSQIIPIESIRRNLPSSTYYPVLQLTKQSTISQHHIGSLDNIPTWCIDDVKIPSYSYDTKQSIDSTTSHYSKNDLLPYTTSKPCTHLAWKDELPNEQKKSNTPSLYSTSHKSSLTKPTTFTKTRSPRKTNLLPSHESRSTRNTNIPYDTRQRIISRTQSPVSITRQRIISRTQSPVSITRQIPTSGIHDNNPGLWNENVPRNLNIPITMLFVHIEQALLNSFNKSHKEDGKESESLETMPLERDDKVKLLPVIHNDEIAGLDYFFYLWNLFNVTPIDFTTVSVGSVVMDKCDLFQYFSQEKCCNVWFVEHSPYIDSRSINSLILFLEAFIEHILFQSSLEVHYMEALSNLILLSWWDIAFGHFESYQLIAYELYNLWIRLISRLVAKSSFIIDQLSNYPEHLNLFIINCLRIYVDFHFHKENSSKLLKDTASQMTGIHASANMQSLSVLYRKSIELLNANNVKKISTVDTLSETMFANRICPAIAEILKKLVRLGLADCLKQNPDLPITTFADAKIVERFNMVRDYLLVRASRLLAYELESTVISSYLPKQFACLVNVTAPKHLVPELLNISLCKSEKTSDVCRNPHIDLISWALEQNLNVADYAFWCVTSTYMKDIEAVNYLLSRLLPHAKLLAKDHSFCYALILHLDHVRKATLPENQHIKLLRAVFEHLSTLHKCDLLESLQSCKNSNRATPLSNSTVHFQTHIRQLFNRLVAYNTNPDDNNGNSNNSNQQMLSLFNKDFLLDCELLLFTNPIRFLVELIRLPVSRKCPHSLTAVHQLLDQLLYVLQVSINFSTATKCLPQTDNSTSDPFVHSTIFQELILVNWSNRKSHKDLSLFGHEDPYESKDGNLFHASFLYEEGKSESSNNDNDLCQSWSSYKLSDNPILDTIIYLFRKPNCIIQINSIVKYFLILVENCILNRSSSDHINHFTPTSCTAPTDTSNSSPSLQSVHIRLFIHVLSTLINDTSIIRNHLNEIDLNELLKQLIQLFSILFLNQLTTVHNDNSNMVTSQDDVTCKQCIETKVFDYLTSNEVDIMLLELIECCFRHSYECLLCNKQSTIQEGAEVGEQQQKCYVKENLSLLNAFKKDILSSMNIYESHKQRCMYLFNALFSSIKTLKSTKQCDDECLNDDINELIDNIFTLSIEITDLQLNSLKHLMNINMFFESTGIQFKNIPIIPSSVEQTESSNSILLPSSTVASETNSSENQMISPRLLYFIFELATVSNRLCNEVLKSVISRSLKPNHLWNNISSGHLLLAVHLFLKKTVRSRQFKCWERLYFLLSKLLKSGILIYPLPTLVNTTPNGSDNIPSRSFYLLDWSKLCGAFDLFAFTSDLFNLWCISLETSSNRRLSRNTFQSIDHAIIKTSDNGTSKINHQKTELYILCYSLCSLVSLLPSVISLHSNTQINKICSGSNIDDCNATDNDLDVISVLKTSQFVQYSRQLAILLLNRLSNSLPNNLISNFLVKSASQFHVVSSEWDRLKQTILLVQQDLSRN
ncbi:hypothetical protein MN116_002425, partial [Schistosoma mekongi]